MQTECEQKGGIPRSESVTMVRKGGIVEGRDREAILSDTGKECGEKKLYSGESEIGLPGECGGIRALGRISISCTTKTYVVDLQSYPAKEWPNIVDSVRMCKLAVVEPQADEEVIWNR